MIKICFTKEHEWARIEDDIATCGISDYAQKALGDIVYVELPSPVGSEFKQHDQAAVVESAKAASEVQMRRWRARLWRLTMCFPKIRQE